MEKTDTGYWNAAWKLESDVRLDEFDDGSLKGTALCDLFIWYLDDTEIREFEEITAGRWDRFATFSIQMTGSLSSRGYELRAVELPLTLPDPSTGGVIDFWDFLFPSLISGEWQSGEESLMQGISTLPQGEDLRLTMRQSNYRASDVTYSWTVRKL